MRQPIPFGKYLLLERINVGGMAEIFLARSRGVQGFKRILAIKKILPTMAEDEEFIAMFVDEARIAAELSHAGIVQIFELGKFAEDYYIAMEFVHGKDLRYIQERMFRDHSLIPVSVSVTIAHKICEALDYAHTKRDPTGRPLGIIHRDISPQNVILSYEGETKICDFGIAKAANRSQKTQAGVLKGKFGYMSPEQVRGLPLDGRSDIFTVGTLLYEMVTLQRLFVGESDFSTLEKVRNADVVPPSTYNREVPAELEDMILKALQKDVDDRFQSAAEFADALQAFLVKQQLLTSSREVSAFMKKTFPMELDGELKRLEEYQDLPDPSPEAATALASLQPGVPEGNDPVKVDLDAKTLIFASSETTDAAGFSPPPIPTAHKARLTQSPDPWNRESGEPTAGAAQPLTDAKTMIFTDAANPKPVPAKVKLLADPKTGQSTVDAAPFSALGEEKTGPTDTDREPVFEQFGSRRSGASSWKEKLLLPVSVVAAILLGWSMFLLKEVRRQESPSPSSIEIVMVPPAAVQVYLDEKKVAAKTPVKLSDVAVGVHRLRLEAADGTKIERNLDVSPGTRLVLELSMQHKEGKTLDEGPVLDKADAGTTPDSSPAIATAPGDVGRQQPETAADRPSNAPAATELVVETDPPGAQLSIDGKKVGVTPYRSRDVNAGQDRVAIFKLEGYEVLTRKFDIKEGQENRFQLSLNKLPGVRPPRPGIRPPHPPVNPPPTPKKDEFGFLLANTKPWSKVYVDGQSTGRETPIAPDRKLRLLVGNHKITFETPAGKRYDFDVTIESGKDLKLIKHLE